MPLRRKPLISLVVPCYNEDATVQTCYEELKRIAGKDRKHAYEFVFVDDGSRDETGDILEAIAVHDKNVRLVTLTRNFGKEMASTAGLREARGAAAILLDADGQHPFDLIPEFVAKWRGGARIVVGVRRNAYGSFWKRITSRWFYRLFNRYSDTRLVPGSTDFRLLDREVRSEFVKLGEHGRMSRSLIEWLGYPADYIYFQMGVRSGGEAPYSFSKLFTLALDSLVSLSLKPLYILAYSGFVALVLSVVLALFSVTEMLIGDPMGLRITGTAYLVMLVLFLLGIILISQGVLALYISHIHTESKDRPLYVIDRGNSRRIAPETTK